MKINTQTIYRIILFVILALAAVGCWGISTDAKIKSTDEGNEMSNTAELERLLTEGDWRAVELAQSIGEASWPVIDQGSRMPKYISRQISLACARRLGGEPSGPILSRGLFDSNSNVRIAAAGYLSFNPPQSAYDAVMKALVDSSEEDIREFMALAAGYFPGNRTVVTLRSIAAGEGILAENARTALAKLGDDGATLDLIQRLSSEDGYTKYKALQDLSYVNNADFASHAKRLINDRSNAVLTGPERRRRFRRVCDQAVDTLVFLLHLAPPFETSVEKIYSDDELQQIKELAY